MSGSARVGVDQLTVTVYGTDTSGAQGDTVRDLYAEVYAEPPYHEGPAEVADFASGRHRTVDQRNFRLVVARWAGEPIGFAFGVPLRVSTTWWDGALTPLPEDITTEYPGRTFAIIELAVRRPYRRRGVGRRLHTHLIAGLSEERVTLLVRPEAPAPQQAYRAWGYRPVGRIRPFPGAPVYHAMIKQLPPPGDADARSHPRADPVGQHHRRDMR
ncbi:MAG: GNAT family N-acetyltransferase [Pseudonocardiales bacterium]|nr:GNAT family N-acetyltransferase [Pseudonocardiales bacterium]